MLTLAIDTATKICTVALCRDRSYWQNIMSMWV